jgi:DNA-binding transcriptional regulator YiaG
MNKHQCSNCDKDAKVVRGSYAFKESGLNVVLQGIELIRCKYCGNEDPIIPRVNDLMRTIAVAVICKPYQLRGEDIRFLRKYLRMTGAEFAHLMDVDKTTLSKWENNDDSVGSQSDRLIRLTVLALGEGLQEKLGEVIRTVFPNIRRTGSKTVPRVGIEINPKNLKHQYT